MATYLESALAVLPLLAFLGFWTALWRGSKDWRASFLIAATLWGVWVVATTELTSLKSLLTRGAVASSWLLACILAWACAAARLRRRESLNLNSSRPVALEEVPVSRMDWALL